jgi:hypothetical protein
MVQFNYNFVVAYQAQYLKECRDEDDEVLFSFCLLLLIALILIAN